LHPLFGPDSFSILESRLWDSGSLDACCPTGHPTDPRERSSWPELVNVGRQRDVESLGHGRGESGPMEESERPSIL
jgi:hypothetical protein